MVIYQIYIYIHIYDIYTPCIWALLYNYYLPILSNLDLDDIFSTVFLYQTFYRAETKSYCSIVFFYKNFFIEKLKRKKSHSSIFLLFVAFHINVGAFLCVLGGSKLVQQKCISGDCSEVDFQLEFQLSEVKVELFHCSDNLLL